MGKVPVTCTCALPFNKDNATFHNRKWHCLQCGLPLPGKHLHRCPGCGHQEECDGCEDPEAPWYCGAWPFQTERCLVLEELQEETEE